jgi:hypothetical protein
MQKDFHLASVLQLDDFKSVNFQTKPKDLRPNRTSYEKIDEKLVKSWPHAKRFSSRECFCS